MKRTMLSSFIAFFLIIVISGSMTCEGQAANTGEWKAGAATVTITPGQSMWLAGYGSRNKPSEGTETELYSKALAIQDANGKKALLITNDLVKIPKNISDRIRDRIGAKYGLTRSQIILNCSHTHSGPVLYNAYGNQYSQISDEQKERIKTYSVKYENMIVDLAGKALSSMKPAKIWSSAGIVRFAVNRRNNVEKELTPLTHLNGPNDYSVPVLKVTDESGSLIAVAFGYACHATCTGFYKWSGDYPGFAQAELEKYHPGATALFFQGAGADQNPLPRGEIAIARQYGRELAAAVERVLGEEMKPLSAEISAAYSEVALPYTDMPSAEELRKISAATTEYPDWHKTWAKTMLTKLEKNEAIEKAYKFYPIQVWKLGEQPIFTLGGELVVEYSLKLKDMFGSDIFVMGYSNDIPSYIPSPTILKEGGYEGIRSQLSSGYPGTYKPEIENIILRGMADLAKKAGVQVRPQTP
jgi:hypothetical protein